MTDQEIPEPTVPEQDSGEDAPVHKPALIINIYSWATPIAGLVMLVIGLVAGFYAYPLVEDRLGSAPAAPAAAADSSVDTAAQQLSPTDVAANATAQASLMDFVVSNTKHFLGDANAPVTIIEFSDFQ